MRHFIVSMLLIIAILSALAFMVNDMITIEQTMIAFGVILIAILGLEGTKWEDDI